MLNRALALDTVGEPDVSSVDVRAGDRFAITSKGVHEVVAADELAALVLLDADLESIATEIADAVEAAQAPDNYSVVLVGIGT